MKPMQPILFLAPFDEMAQAAASAAEQLGMAIALAVADDDHAVEAVRKHPEVEVVVSRGGVAQRVRALPHLSVVEVAMQAEQFLEPISRYAGQGLRRIGFVGHHNVLGGVSGDYRMGDVHVAFRSCLTEAQIRQCVDELVQAGAQVILGCRLGYVLARQQGIAAERLTTSAQSIRQALEEAQRLVQVNRAERLHSAQLTAIINNIDAGVIAINDLQQVSFCNPVARSLLTTASGQLDDKAIAELRQNRGQERIAYVHGNPVLAKSIPLDSHGRRLGQVITLQETSSIQTHERKIRLSLHQKGLYAKKTMDDLLGDSKVMRDLKTKAGNYARHDSNLLIFGETGTGKEVLAQSVHNASQRSKGPFVSVNTASLPPSLLESELFGYVEGAFTGAKKGGKPGLFELAHEGTIFLDEIGELDPQIQSRLLRVLQEKEIMRLGDDKIVPVDVRIIAATNKDLSDMVRQGKFREDLYYRIYVLGLRLPPLRERTEDIALLMTHCLQEMAAKTGMPVSLTEGALQALRHYPWPGNLRQLRNVAEVMAYSGASVVDAGIVGDILAEQATRIGSRASTPAAPEPDSLQALEAQMLQQLLAAYPPDEVCRRLGISRVTLWRKKKKLLQPGGGSDAQDEV